MKLTEPGIYTEDSPGVYSKEVNGMTPAKYSRFLQFLEEDLSLSTSSIAIALRHREHDPGPIAMILWQYGLVTLEQLDRIFDWLETAQP
jgi:hypothetical protein